MIQKLKNWAMTSNNKYLVLITAIVVFAFVHEGIHALLAMIFGEYQSFRVHPYGLEVIYKTVVAEREGIKWGFISGISNISTLFLGYCLFLIRTKAGSLQSRFLRNLGYWTTIFFMLGDPFNLSIGPFIYGGDIGGLVAGFGISKYLLQGFFFMLLLFNRELIAQGLLPVYGIKTNHPFFRPWVKP
jgi:hypothetical protein